MITRRNFCAVLAGLVAAPYVIRNSGVLMPVRDRSLYASYLVTGLDAMGLHKREMLRVPIPLIAPDITGFHTLARMANIEWKNIRSIECTRSLEWTDRDYALTGIRKTQTG